MSSRQYFQSNSPVGLLHSQSSPLHSSFVLFLAKIFSSPYLVYKPGSQRKYILEEPEIERSF
jgi:hypothetical protein